MEILFEFGLVSYCEKRERIDDNEFVLLMGIPTPLFMHTIYSATFTVFFISSTAFEFSFPTVPVAWRF